MLACFKFHCLGVFKFLMLHCLKFIALHFAFLYQVFLSYHVKACFECRCHLRQRYLATHSICPFSVLLSGMFHLCWLKVLSI
jgi:hypothetical protein